MDRKVLFRAVLWALVAYLLFMMIVNSMWPPPQVADQPTTQPTTQPVSTPTATSGELGVPSTLPARPDRSSTPTTTSSPSSGSLATVGEDLEQTLVLGSAAEGRQSDYRAEIHLSNIGASVESVLLSDYKVAVDSDESYRLVDPVEVNGKTLRSLAFEKILIDNEELRLDKVLWRSKRTNSTEAQAVIFECDILRDDRPLVRLKRRYALAPTTLESRRYDFTSELTFENLSDENHVVRLTQRGVVGIQREDRRIDDRGFNAGIFLEGQVQPQSMKQADAVAKNTNAIERLWGSTVDSAEDQGRLWWVTAENKYFAFITTPVKPDGGEDPGYVYEACVVDLDGDTETLDDVIPQMVLGPFTLVPGDSTTLQAEHYIGPKDKRVFQDGASTDYVRRNYSMLLQDRLFMCTFAWLAELMVTLLNAFYSVVHNYGVAIFLLVLVVRGLLHPITKKTQVNMVKMQQAMGKLQPKLEEIKKRYANDKVRLQQETMRLYKEEGVNPAGQMLSCLPMVLQMPIWIALYSSLNNNIAMRHEGFFLWIRDLTGPDQLIPFTSGFQLPLVGEVTALNLLPLLVGLTMYIQQKLMPKPSAPATGQSDQAAQMQKQMQTMMPLMSIFMVLIFYNMPSGLNLYIMTSSILGALEQWRIRKHVEAEKERLDREPPLVTDPGPKPKKPRPPSFLERLAKKADDAQKLRRPPK